MRKVIHIDMDCFFAAIEMRDNPKLRNLPVAIGGSSEGRGVLCTANYEARKFGVRSAMPTAHALKLCPQLVLIKPNSSKYKEASHQIKNIFARYTDKIEPLSLDEAYLDVTGSELFHGSAQLLAEKIRNEIFMETGLTASAGVSCNKFLAKVASDWNKPNGMFVVTPNDVAKFVSQLPVEKIPGVGRVTTERLHQLGIKNCHDLQQVPLAFLNMQFGSFGKVLYDRSRGFDNREVESLRLRKSLSVETTFSKDKNLEELILELPSLEEEFTYRLEKLKLRGEFKIKQLFIKLKFSDFKIVTCEQRKHEDFLIPLNTNQIIDSTIHNFLKDMIVDSFGKSDLKVRLMGVGARFFTEKEAPSGQLDFLKLLAG